MSLENPTKLTGEGGMIKIAGVEIPITSWSWDIPTDMKDATDSSNYSKTKKRLFSSKRPGRIDLSVDIEGNFTVEHTPTYIVAKILTRTLVEAELWISQDPIVKFAKGNFWLTAHGGEVGVQEADMVTFSATLENEGEFQTFDDIV